MPRLRCKLLLLAAGCHDRGRAAYVKANFTTLNVSHAGVGPVFFTTYLLLNSILNVKPALVPFNGGGPAMSALVAGQVDNMCGDGPPCQPRSDW
jgi:tripartite-type tricarboxylate transporter receptor subunit TctC